MLELLRIGEVTREERKEEAAGFVRDVSGDSFKGPSVRGDIRHCALEAFLGMGKLLADLVACCCGCCETEFCKVPT